MSEDAEHYPEFPLALLNTLTYLDFTLIEKQDRDAAVEKFEIRVKEMEHKEEKLLKERQQEEQAAFELNQVDFTMIPKNSKKSKNSVKTRSSIT